jgi:hypothetical protein
MITWKTRTECEIEHAVKPHTFYHLKVSTTHMDALSCMNMHGGRKGRRYSKTSIDHTLISKQARAFQRVISTVKRINMDQG